MATYEPNYESQDPLGDGSGVASYLESGQEGGGGGDATEQRDNQDAIEDANKVGPEDLTGPVASDDGGHAQAQEDALSTAGAKNQDITPSVTMQSFADRLSKDY